MVSWEAVPVRHRAFRACSGAMLVILSSWMRLPSIFTTFISIVSPCFASSLTFGGRCNLSMKNPAIVSYRGSSGISSPVSRRVRSTDSAPGTVRVFESRLISYWRSADRLHRRASAQISPSA